MKKIIFVLCALTLAACGSKGDKKSSGGETLGNGDQPQVSVPAGALFTDYSCNRLEEVSENGGPIMTKTSSYGGVERSWQEDGFSVAFGEDTDGLYKSLSRQKVDVLATGERHSLNYGTEWFKQDNRWQKKQSTTESLYTYDQAGAKKYIYRRVDGRETPPVWDSQTSDNGPKSYRIFMRHLNPGMLNRDGRVYTRVEEACIYTDR